MSAQSLTAAQKANPAYGLSLAAAALAAALSLAGLLFPGSVYPTQALRQSFVSNDVVTLLICLPVLFGAIMLARRNSLVGLLVWPGALFFLTYNYLAYTAAMPLTWQAVFYLVLVLLTIAAIFRLLTRMDARAIQKRLTGAVAERFSGGVLIALGILFILMAVGKIAGALAGQAPLAAADLGVTIADLVICSAWVAGGVLLWRRHPFGYISGAGLLFQGSMLFIGLLVYFILQPFLAGVPFPADDFVVIAVMGLVCFVPCGLYIRGILKGTKPA